MVTVSWQVGNRGEWWEVTKMGNVLDLGGGPMGMFSSWKFIKLLTAVHLCLNTKVQSHRGWKRKQCQVLKHISLCYTTLLSAMCKAFSHSLSTITTLWERCCFMKGNWGMVIPKERVIIDKFVVWDISYFKSSGYTSLWVYSLVYSV